LKLQQAIRSAVNEDEGDPATVRNAERKIIEEICQIFPDSTRDLDKEAENIALTFLSLYETASKIRYSVTMLFAAADELLGVDDDLSNGDKTADAVARACNFLEHAKDMLRGQATRQQRSSVVDLIFHVMEKLHRERAKPPLDIGSIKRLGPNSHRVLLLILWHMAVIGEPVDADVLAHCPEIGVSLQELVNDKDDRGVDGSDNTDVSTLIRDLLGLLEYRCLVFQVGARSGYREDFEDGSASSTPMLSPIQNDLRKLARRFAIHRTVQRVIFRQLDAPIGQFRTSDRYSLSLYYSQPSDLPRPSYDSHQRLRRLVESLSGYPTVELDRLSAADGAAATFAAARLWPWRLRAAYGVLVSVYNVAVIGRIDIYRDSQDNNVIAPLGHYEAQRQLVHWLIRQTSYLNDLYEKMKDCSGRLKACDRGMCLISSGRKGRLALCELTCQAVNQLIPPFYKEELVWLYNEVGVLSLVQGRVNDATAMFRQALQLSRDRITTNDASLAARIGLNSAIADIERGASDRIAERVNRVLARADEDPTIRALAIAIKGWVRHLGGELDFAIGEYKKAIAEFNRTRASRAASMINRFLGDAYRAKGEQYWELAEQTLSLAEKLAREGGHEDAAQLARISQARLLVQQGRQDTLRKAQDVLNGVEQYAKIAGVPRMTVELNLVRAEAVLTQGENTRALELASQALELATLHDLRLYKARALAVLAQTLQKLGVINAARLVHRRAEELARRSKYTSMVKHLQDNQLDSDPRVTR